MPLNKILMIAAITIIFDLSTKTSAVLSATIFGAYVAASLGLPPSEDSIVASLKFLCVLAGFSYLLSYYIHVKYGYSISSIWLLERDEWYVKLFMINYFVVSACFFMLIYRVLADYRRTKR